MDILSGPASPVRNIVGLFTVPSKPVAAEISGMLNPGIDMFGIIGIETLKIFARELKALISVFNALITPLTKLSIPLRSPAIIELKPTMIPLAVATKVFFTAFQPIVAQRGKSVRKKLVKNKPACPRNFGRSSVNVFLNPLSTHHLCHSVRPGIRESINCDTKNGSACAAAGIAAKKLIRPAIIPELPMICNAAPNPASAGPIAFTVVTNPPSPNPIDPMNVRKSVNFLIPSPLLFRQFLLLQC